MGEHPDIGTATSLVVGVSGHRKLRAADLPRLAGEVRAFLRELQTRYPELPLVLLSPLAEGADALAADVAFELGLRVIAPLPLPVAQYRKDFERADSLARFERQLARAEVLVLPTRGDHLSGSAQLAGAARDRQYAEAGIFVSRHCHVLLALWDGHDQDAVGGTSDAVRFHLHGNMRGQAGPRRASLSLLGIDENTLVRHIPAMRDRATSPAASRGRWLTAHDGIVAHDAMPGAFDRMFRSQAEFNADLGKYASAIADECADQGGGEGYCPIRDLFMRADWMARTYQQRVARVLRATYLLAAVTGGAFLVYEQVPSQDAMIYVYLLLFSAGVGLAMLARRREWHRKYLDYRALAEGLRVQSYWRRAGVVDLDNPSCANENFMQEQDTELGWIRNVLRTTSLEGLLVPVGTAAEEVDAVIREWIGTPESNGQLRYFAVTGARRARRHRNAQRLALASLAVGITICIVLAILARGLDDSLKTALVLAMGLLSVGAGVHEAYAHKKADKELVKQYRFMERIYAGARRRLDAAAGLGEKREVLQILGEAALAEHAEWTLMHRERPLEHTRLGG
jgi:hypothetical protein